MTSLGPIPLVLGSLVGLLLAMLIGGLVRIRRHRAEGGVDDAGVHHNVLLGLLAFAVVALGVFLAYALLSIGLRR